MAAKYEVEVKVLSATNLKNVNWKNGPLRPYIVAWLDADSSAKVTTSVAPLADSGPDGADPISDAADGARAKMVLQLPQHALLIDVVHAKDDDRDVEKVKPLVGSARIALRDVLEEVGIGEKAVRAVRIKRPSGRPQGVLELEICVREPPSRYGNYESHPPPAGAAGGYPANPASRDASYGYGAPATQPPAGYPYGSTAPSYGSGVPPAGYPAYGAAPPAGYAAYGAAPPAGYAAAPAVAPVAEKKKSKFGVGTGVAVGAPAGLIGGIAIAEGIDHSKDDIAEDAAEKVEDDLADKYGGYNDECKVYDDDSHINYDIAEDAAEKVKEDLADKDEYKVYEDDSHDIAEDAAEKVEDDLANNGYNTAFRGYDEYRFYEDDSHINYDIAEDAAEMVEDDLDDKYGYDDDSYCVGDGESISRVHRLVQYIKIKMNL